MKVGYKIIMWRIEGPITKTYAVKELKKTCVRYFQKNEKAKCIKRYLLLVYDKFVFKSFNKLYTLITTNQIKLKIHKCTIILMYTSINISSLYQNGNT